MANFSEGRRDHLDEQKDHRDWSRRFDDQEIKLSPVDDEEFPGGRAVTICDGTKHRTLVTGSCDLLASITPCDHGCDSWQEGKGTDVRDVVPNLSEKWFVSEEDIDRSDLVREII